MGRCADTIRVVPLGKRANKKEHTPQQRLELFDLATERQHGRQGKRAKNGSRMKSLNQRGWTRADIYRRDLAD
jgi:hypothetical protein